MGSVPNAELAYVDEAAAVHGLDSIGLTIERVETGSSAGPISALRYGYEGTSAPARLALLHGGGQNAHTWDLTMVALGLPALALDLPGHGSSAWLPDHDYSPRRHTAAVSEALTTLAPEAEVLVGMSLGGMVALTVAPSLASVRHIVLVDVSPGSALPSNFAAAELQRQRGASFEHLVEQVKTASPRRPPGAVRHAVWHSTRTGPEGRQWRNDPRMRVGSFLDLWPDLSSLAPRVTEVLATERSFVPDADRACLRELLGERVVEIEGAAHSVQNTRPKELAAVLRGVA